uniref:Uncharacterized protein n=1 Tax=Avena sativa TaxID=4498 RepID=A0ACD5THZ8_AVESA
MDITQILLAAQSPDGNLRAAAEGNIKQFQEQNLPNFLLSLSVELSSDERPPESRRLAGIILKNSLDAKDSAKKELLIQQWVSLDPSIKLKIKESLLMTLGSSVADARQTSSQVIAKVASIEIPRREWQDLIAKLLSYMTQPGASAPLKQATLEALGYVCEEIPPEHLEQDQVNAVLTAVVQGMNQTELSSEVRLAAVKALYNALDFAESNFANEMERTFIMKVICETAVSKEVEIRQAAFECLVAIASTYYVHLDPYMQTIFNLTANAVKGDEEQDMVDYGNQLRRGIFEAYSGILQGIKGTKAQLMLPYAGHLLQFTEAVYKDSSRDESVTKAAVAVLGDLADTLGPISKDLFKSHLFHVEFLRECLDLDDEVRETASWTQGMINQAIVS